MKVSLASLSALGLLTALAPISMAQDTLVRVRGTVSAVIGPLRPMDVGIFLDTEVGDAVTLDMRVQPGAVTTLANGTKVYDFGPDGMRMTIGAETDALLTVNLSGFQIRDTPGGDDGFTVLVPHSGVAGPLVEVVAFDITGTPIWNSDDPVALQGQTFDMAGAFRRFNIAPFNGPSRIDVDFASVSFLAVSPVGQTYCAAVPNSTGELGTLSALGSASVAENDLVLLASDLPRDVIGFFVGSQLQGFVAGPGGSAGNLCLSGPIGRYISGGFAVQTGSTGRAALPLDLSALATPMVNVAAQAGETWNFQLWHRDNVGGQATSNFTDALSITFE